MNKFFVSLFVICLINSPVETYSEEHDTIIMGYYMAWSQWIYEHSDVPYDQLTHIAHAFVWPEDDGNLTTYEYFHYPQLIQSAEENDVKIIISVGGWGQSDGFSPMAADSASRSRFIQEIIEFCEEYGYIGIDLDWEYPQSADRANVVKLVRELRDSINELELDYTISIALPSVDWQNGYDIPALRDYIDWFGVMTYDFHGSWTQHSGHNSPLYPPIPHQCQHGSIKQSVDAYLLKGVPPSKLLVGLANYGRQFNTPDLYASPPQGINIGGDPIRYYEAVEKIEQGWSHQWDPVSYGPYLINEDSTQVVAYDDTVSFRYKAEYIGENQLRGAKVWALGYDFVDNEQPLFETLRRELDKITSVDRIAGNHKVSGYHLYQNYPNPFNPTTVIRYDIRENERVVLKIHNVLGQEIVTLVDQVQPPGTYQVTFDASNLSSGVYFYRLNAGDYAEVRNMLFMQ